MGMNGWRPSASSLQDPDRKPKPGSAWPTIKPFVNGGASGMLATCVFQPIDMIKTRTQLGQGSAVQVTVNMLKQEGFGAFYKGLSAGLLQKATYSTAAIAWLQFAMNKTIVNNDGKPLTMHQKLSCIYTSIIVGAFAGSPADLALTRMQADYTLPVAQRRNYKNVFHALHRIVAEEGYFALLKGAGPTVLRTFHTRGSFALGVPSAQFFKDNFGFGDRAAIVGAILVGGFYSTAWSLPFDYIKTQIQKMQPDSKGKFPYTGLFDCASKTFKAGGVFKFYSGFPVYYLRGVPHALMTGVLMVQIMRIEMEFGL